jgi:hypothetical protein
VDKKFYLAVESESGSKAILGEYLATCYMFLKWLRIEIEPRPSGLPISSHNHYWSIKIDNPNLDPVLKQ